MSFKAFAQPILSFWVRGRAVIACIPGCPLGGLWVDSGWPLGLLGHFYYPGTIRGLSGQSAGCLLTQPGAWASGPNRRNYQPRHRPQTNLIM